MAVPSDIRQSDPRFEDSWAECSYDSNLPKYQFDKQVRNAVRVLLDAGPGRDDGINNKKWAAIDDRYRLVYSWAIDRDKKGNPISHHLVLLLVERS